MNPEKIKIEEGQEPKLESTNQLIAQEKSILQKFQGKAKKIVNVLILVTALSATVEIGLPKTRM